MFVAIANTSRDYAWGSRTAISELLGTTPSGAPEAELWLGAHDGAPSRIVEPSVVGGAANLLEWIASDPVASLGARRRLPFLLKVLAAAGPLSLQAHPTAEQAREGFARENALGIPLDAPHRNYRDEYSKPEIIVAVSEKFEALCGFRPSAEAAEVLTALGLAGLVTRLDDLPELFAWLVRGGTEVDSLVTQLAAHVATQGGDGEPLLHGGSSVARDAVDTVQRLVAAYPGDPGIVCALLLNRVTLSRGDALYLPAGNIHAYLEGVGIEVMTASDNVLRGGLTGKHVDVHELLRVVDFTSGPAPRLTAERPSPRVQFYRPPVDDFALARITNDAEISLTGPAIGLCVSGSLHLSGAKSSVTISRGESVFITPDEESVSTSGHGEIYFATTP